ncbi:MAG TPA: hypothetical protein VFC56_13580 [Stellaceae bacterium]|nr:hypothetical protein [Stellaceae bacterium]
MTEATIHLGGRKFTIEPLRLGQLRALLDALDDLSGKTGGAVIDAAARVIQAGLVRAHPGLTLDAVLELDATMDEVTEAVAMVLTVAGLRRPEDTRSGEAVPVASAEQIPAPVAAAV